MQFDSHRPLQIQRTFLPTLPCTRIFRLGDSGYDKTWAIISVKRACTFAYGLRAREHRRRIEQTVI